MDPITTAPQQKELTIKEIAFLANMAQNAVNLSGLVHDWSKWQTTIRADARTRGIAPNKHPINIIMADKIADLARGDYFDAALTVLEIANATQTEEQSK